MTSGETNIPERAEKERRYSHDHSRSASKADSHSHSASGQSDLTSSNKKQRFSTKIEGLVSISELDEKARDSVNTKATSPHTLSAKVTNEETNGKRESRRHQRHSAKVSSENPDKSQTFTPNNNAAVTDNKAEKVLICYSLHCLWNVIDLVVDFC
jgi:hypothetical protein